MFETKKLTREKIEQRRKERKAIKRKPKIAHPERYVCVKQSSHRKELYFKRLFRKRRYYARKLYFSVAKTFGLVE